MGILAIIGTLVGVFVGFAGNYLIQRQLKSWQREQWVLEAKKAEWRELIGILCQSKNRAELHISTGSDGEGITVREGEASRIVDEADAEAKRTIEDRIFISEKVKNAKILSDWLMLMAASTYPVFYDRWSDLHTKMVKLAMEDLQLKD